MSKAVKGRTVAGSAERQQIAEKVFAAMRQGLSAHMACKSVGLPQSTLNDWLNSDSALAAEYARAREDLIEHIAAETIAIADAPVGSTDNGSTDNGAVAKQRLQVDTRKWLLSKLAPKKYGDHLTLAGDDKSPLKLEVNWKTAE